MFMRFSESRKSGWMWSVSGGKVSFFGKLVSLFKVKRDVLLRKDRKREG